MLNAFLLETGKLFANVQGRNEGDTIPRAPNHCGRLRKVPIMSQVFSSIDIYRVHMLPKDLRFEHGVA